MDTLPPDDSTPETRRWEQWAGTVQVGDVAYARGDAGIVTEIADDYIAVRVDGYTEAERFEWWDVDGVP